MRGKATDGSAGITGGGRLYFIYSFVVFFIIVNFFKFI